MSVSMSGNTIRIEVPLKQNMMAYYYRKVGNDWVKYRREFVDCTH